MKHRGSSPIRWTPLTDTTDKGTRLFVRPSVRSFVSYMKFETYVMWTASMQPLNE